MKKAVALILVLTVLCAVLLSGCGESEKPAAKTEKVTLNVSCIKGPTGFGMAKLMGDAESGSTENLYNFSVVSSADEITGKFLSGDIDIISIPTNLAAKLYAKSSGNVTLLAVNTLGTLSIVEDGESIKSFSDLKGKTIYAMGEGSNPEYILKYLLKQNGIDPISDVKIVFSATSDELISYIVSGKAKIAMIPEPAATTVLTKKQTLRRALSVNDVWKEKTGKQLMMGCVIAKKSFANENKEIINNFLSEYEASINFTESNTQNAAELCEKYGIVPKAAIALKSIPESNLTFSVGFNSAEDLKSYFEILRSFDKTSIGGALPNEDFYYKK